MDISKLVVSKEKNGNKVTLDIKKCVDPFLSSDLEGVSQKILMAALNAFLLTPIEIETARKDPKSFTENYTIDIKLEGRETLGMFKYQLKMFGYKLNINLGRDFTTLSFECRSEREASYLYNIINKRNPETIMQAFQDFYPKD